MSLEYIAGLQKYRYTLIFEYHILFETFNSMFVGIFLYKLFSLKLLPDCQIDKKKNELLREYRSSKLTIIEKLISNIWSIIQEALTFLTSL